MILIQGNHASDSQRTMSDTQWPGSSHRQMFCMQYRLWEGLIRFATASHPIRRSQNLVSTLCRHNSIVKSLKATPASAMWSLRYRLLPIMRTPDLGPLPLSINTGRLDPSIYLQEKESRLIEGIKMFRNGTRPSLGLSNEVSCPEACDFPACARYRKPLPSCMMTSIAHER